MDLRKNQLDNMSTLLSYLLSFDATLVPIKIRGFEYEERTIHNQSLRLLISKLKKVRVITKESSRTQKIQNKNGATYFRGYQTILTISKRNLLKYDKEFRRYHWLNPF